MFQIIGASVEIYSEDECFKGMFFQDLKMKQAFHAHPELILIDATCNKLLQLIIKQLELASKVNEIKCNGDSYTITTALQGDIE